MPLFSRTRLKDVTVKPEPGVTLKPGPLSIGDAVTLSSIIDKVNKLLSGLIYMGTGQDGSWSGHMDGQYRRILTDPVNDVTFIVPHGLGRVPIGYIVVDRAAACNIYTAPDQGWTKEAIYLRCYESGPIEVLLWIF